MVADTAGNAGLGAEIRELREIVRYYDERIAAIDAVYSAWLDAGVTTIEDRFEIVCDLADVKASHTDYGTYTPNQLGSSRPTSLLEMYAWHGVAVEASWDRQERAPVTPGSNPNAVVARLAEGVTLTVVEHVHGQAVASSRSRAMVANTSSEHVEYELARSLFGRKSLDLAFSANGYLTGLGAEGEAALGEVAKALAAAPGQVASGVESVTKFQTGLASVRRAGLDAELARVKADVELRQQRAIASGLDLTTADASRLERLKQLQSILDTQSKIGQSDPSLVAALGSAQDLSWYSPPAPTPPPRPQEIHVLLEQRTNPQ